MLSAIPEIRGPILDTVVRNKLYKCATELMIPLNQILGFNLKEIGHQIMIQKSNDETAEDVQSYNGPFNNIPKEIMFKIFSYLNLYSLGNMQVKHKAIILLETWEYRTSSPYPDIIPKGKGVQ